jgi:hypothetical protein
MEHSNLSLIQANELIINKEKIYKEKPKRNKSINIFLCYGLSISILVNIILFSYIFLFPKKSSINNGIKYIINKINTKRNQIKSGNSIDNYNNTK